MANTRAIRAFSSSSANATSALLLKPFPFPEGFLRDRCQICIAQWLRPFSPSCRSGRKATGWPCWTRSPAQAPPIAPVGKIATRPPDTLAGPRNLNSGVPTGIRTVEHGAHRKGPDSYPRPACVPSHGFLHGPHTLRRNQSRTNEKIK